MISKRYVNKITKVLKEWKDSVDVLETKYLEEKRDLERFCAERAGQWTQDYIIQYRDEHSPDEKYIMAYKATKEPVQSTIEQNLSIILNQLDSFFGAPVSSEFANTIMATKLTGLQLSNFELELLKKSVSTYAEARLLNQLATSRTRQTDIVQIEDKGEWHKSTKEVTDPYLYLEIPDMEATYKNYENFKSSALRMVNSYAGKSGTLNFALDHILPAHLCVAMDSFIRTKADEKFMEAIEKANSALVCANKDKRTYTEKDRSLIDRLISPAYVPAKETVHAVAALNEEIKTLLLLDPRYKNFFADDEE